MVLPIDHQYYEYTQAHELISDRKTSFCKQHHSENCYLTFGRYSLINKMKKDNEADRSGTEAAAVSALLPLDPSLMSPKHWMISVQIRKFFWSVFSCIQTEYGDLRSTS